jgi:DNA primase
MADSKILLQEIKNLVSIRDIYDRYVGLPPDSSHRFQCPFNHDEDRKNFVINSKMWHCFSCGCSGDQVTLVQKVFDLSFTDALTKITYDFNLQVGDYNELSVRARIGGTLN